MNHLYLGYDWNEVSNAGRDLLAERFLAGGEPSLERMRGILPPVELGAYWFLSGAATQGSTLVDDRGRLYDQEQNSFSPGRLLRGAEPFFEPESLDAELGRIKPAFRWAPGAPILLWAHAQAKEALEFEAFVQPLDPGTHPHTWLRATRLRAGKTLWVRRITFCPSGIQEVWPGRRVEPGDAAYQAARTGTIDWWAQRRPPIRFELPEGELSALYERVMIQARLTFCGAHPKYGHAFYGVSLGDNFPPNMICMIEAALLSGDGQYACELARYALDFCVQPDGAFAYYGPSAAEYGQLLWILERAERALRPWGGLTGRAEAIARMAEHLLSLRNPQGLIAAGAEADTRSRVGVYANNNLWAARGLYAADRLIGCLGGAPRRFEQAAGALCAATLRALSEQAADTQFGAIPPFRLGYPALPWTLSCCREPTAPLFDAALDQYLDRGYPRGDIEGVQDLSENTYANYRYYPEMLSSGLLEPAWERAIVRMRRAAGGELLCMTRLYGWLDDWPAFHCARYLLENGERDRYLTLLYAHALHHGRMEMGTYYEQVGFDGRVVAEDCVPALLLPALMLCWAFAFEPVREEALYLGRGVPESWYAEGAVGVSRMMCRWGTLCWRAVREGDVIALECQLPAIEAPVFWHAPCAARCTSAQAEQIAPALFRIFASAQAPTTLSLRFECRAETG